MGITDIRFAEYESAMFEIESFNNIDIMGSGQISRVALVDALEKICNAISIIKDYLIHVKQENTRGGRLVNTDSLRYAYNKVIAIRRGLMYKEIDKMSGSSRGDKFDERLDEMIERGFYKELPLSVKLCNKFKSEIEKLDTIVILGLGRP